MNYEKFVHDIVKEFMNKNASSYLDLFLNSVNKPFDWDGSSMDAT